MHGFLRLYFFSEARCKDSCFAEIFLMPDATVLALQEFQIGEIWFILRIGNANYARCIASSKNGRGDSGISMIPAVSAFSLYLLK